MNRQQPSLGNNRSACRFFRPARNELYLNLRHIFSNTPDLFGKATENNRNLMTANSVQSLIGFW
jgi:hypothetical protein